MFKEIEAWVAAAPATEARNWSVRRTLAPETEDERFVFHANRLELVEGRGPGVVRDNLGFNVRARTAEEALAEAAKSLFDETRWSHHGPAYPP